MKVRPAYFTGSFRRADLSEVEAQDSCCVWPQKAAMTAVANGLPYLVIRRNYKVLKIKPILVFLLAYVYALAQRPRLRERRREPAYF